VILAMVVHQLSYFMFDICTMCQMQFDQVSVFVEVAYFKPFGHFTVDNHSNSADSTRSNGNTDIASIIYNASIKSWLSNFIHEVDSFIGTSDQHQSKSEHEVFQFCTILINCLFYFSKCLVQ
jgi:hypothetical protein